jgi:hypothetical protein
MLVIPDDIDRQPKRPNSRIDRPSAGAMQDNGRTTILNLQRHPLPVIPIARRHQLMRAIRDLSTTEQILLLTARPS